MRSKIAGCVVMMLTVPLWGQVGGAVSTGTGAPAVAAVSAPTAEQIARMQARLADWPQLSYYREANAGLAPVAAGEQRVVFFGASVAEFWGKRGGAFRVSPISTGASEGRPRRRCWCGFGRM